MIRVRGQGAGKDYDVALSLTSQDNGPGNFEWTIEGFPPGKPPAVAGDLLRVARGAHLADRLVRRGHNFTRSQRKIKVDIPVAEPAKWRRLSPLLERLVEFATGGDEWSFSFSKAAGDSVFPEVAGAARKMPSRPKPSVIALFSGGLDSLCGAAYLASLKNSEPHFVTHSPPGQETIQKLTRKTFERFGRKLAQGTGTSFRLEVREANVTGVRSMFQEPSRRTRPFYFLALACATAIGAETPDVQMSENGALALSLPYRFDVHGPLMARQAHTFLLHGFERLLSELIPDVAWAVRNPFVNETKGEACLRLGPAKDLAVLSASCEYLGRQRAVMISWKRQHRKRAKVFGDGPHCGLCVPCLVRRAALKRARIEDSDANYYGCAPAILADVDRRGSAIDFFGRDQAPPLMNMLVPNVVYMDRHCKWLSASSLPDFAARYLPELRAGRPLSGSPSMNIREMHELARRYATEILDFLNG